MIRLRNVSYKYSASEDYVLRNINLDINQGEFIAILGKNGSGKSTLARLFNAILIPQEGQVEVDGLTTCDPRHHIAIRKKVGLLLPNPDNQLISNIVEEDIAFGPENLGLASEEIRQRVDTALNMVSMEEFAKHPPYLLSGGQKQRVAIAGILAIRPEYLVLDEPTSMLDPEGRKEVLETLFKLRRDENITLIWITHDLKEVLQADRWVLFDKGEIRVVNCLHELIKQSYYLTRLGIEPLEITRLITAINDNSSANLDKDILSADKLVERLCQLK